MGSCSSSSGSRIHFVDELHATDAYQSVSFPKSVKAVMVGLTASGKSTVFATLTNPRKKSLQPSTQAKCVISPSPTAKCHTAKLQLDAFALQLTDTPGDALLRAQANKPLAAADIVVLTVDAADPSKLPLAREVLDELVHAMKGRLPPVLVLATKTDLPEALSVMDIAERLQMHTFTASMWAVDSCSNVERDDLKHVRDLRHVFTRFAKDVYSAEQR